LIFPVTLLSPLGSGPPR